MDNRLNEMQTEVLWNKAREAGMSRRKFLALLASSGAAAVLAACAPKAVTTPTATPKATATPTPTSTPTLTPAPKTVTSTAQTPITIVHQAPFGKTTMTVFAGSEPFLDKIEQRSNGRIVFKRFYDASLVSTNAALEGVAKGTIDMTFSPGNYFESVVPEGDLDLMYFNFPSQVAAGLWLDLPEVQKIYRDAYAKAGVYLIGSFAHSGAALLTNFPITKMDDLKGKKIRGPGGSANKALEALGTVPVFIAIPEQYTALQRGTIDGASTGEYLLIANKYHEVLKYAMLPWPMPAMGERYFINPKKWQELGPELQKLVSDIFREHAYWYVMTAIHSDEQMRTIIQSTTKVQYTQVAPEEFAKMKAATEPVKAAWAKRTAGTARLYELLQAWEKRKDYRQWFLD